MQSQQEGIVELALSIGQFAVMVKNCRLALPRQLWQFLLAPAQGRVCAPSPAPPRGSAPARRERQEQGMPQASAA